MQIQLFGYLYTDAGIENRHHKFKPLHRMLSPVLKVPYTDQQNDKLQFHHIYGCTKIASNTENHHMTFSETSSVHLASIVRALLNEHSQIA